MTKIDTIYLDMDGVLSDFMSRYRQLSGEWKLDSEGKPSENWSKFCSHGHFANLDVWPGWYALTSYIDLIAPMEQIRVEILTSTGGAEFHDQVAQDKQSWCLQHGLRYKVNAVPGRWKKRDWARADAVLIDDTADVVDGFRQAGGLAILHTDVDTTIQQLKIMLDI